VPGGEVEVGECERAGFADPQAAPAQERDQEAFLQRPVAVEQCLVFTGAEPVVVGWCASGRLDLSHRVRQRVAVTVGDQVEAVEVGVEGAERVDLGAVARSRGWPTVALVESVLPVFEVAVDLLGRECAGRSSL